MATRTSRSDLALPPHVYKFRGSSVGTPDAIRAAVAHVKEAAPRVAVAQ